MMSHKISFLTVFSLAVAAFSPLSSLAADDATINVTATIVATPCTVDTKTLTFALGNYNATDVTSSMAWSDPQDITLSACPASTTKINATFTGTADATDTDGYKNEAAGGPANVSVELANPTGTLLKNNMQYGDVVVANSKATFTFKARLKGNTGTVMPGEVSSAIQVNFEYK